MAFHFRLEFDTPYAKTGKTEFPGHADAYVKLGMWKQRKNGAVLVGPDCACMQEMNATIDMLKEELEDVRKAANLKFEEHDRREKLWIQRRRTEKG